MKRPRMHTDAHGSETDLTKGVVGSAFKVANVLGSAFVQLIRGHYASRWISLPGTGNGSRLLDGGQHTASGGEFLVGLQGSFGLQAFDRVRHEFDALARRE